VLPKGLAQALGPLSRSRLKGFRRTDKNRNTDQCDTWPTVIALALLCLPAIRYRLGTDTTSSDQGEQRRTTISIPVPNQAGAALKTVVLSQLPNPDQWYWGRRAPKTYLGSYNL
jgi:hypothetical protein